MKSWYQSKTIWANLATLLAVVQVILSGAGYIPNNQTVNIASESWVVISPLLNLYLRKITNSGIK